MKDFQARYALLCDVPRNFFPPIVIFLANLFDNLETFNYAIEIIFGEIAL